MERIITSKLHPNYIQRKIPIYLLPNFQFRSQMAQCPRQNIKKANIKKKIQGKFGGEVDSHC